MDSNGWDVVYACSGNYINKQLASSQDEYIQSFAYEDSAIKMSGSFGIWQIVPGGSGPILQFNTPITQGSVTIKSTNETIPLDGAIPLVQMQLSVIKAPPGEDITHNLVFNCTILGKGNGDTTSGAVTVIDPDTSGNLQKEKDGALAAALLVTGLGNCFLQNAAQLGFVFANVLPVPTGQNSDWLTPKAMAYAYQQPSNNTLGGLAILGLLDSTDMSNLPRYFDSNLLVQKDFGFILSARPFMQNVIMPALPAAFGGNALINDFALNSDNIIVQSQPFSLDDVKVGLINYSPDVTSLSFSIEDTSMRCFVDTKTDITGLVDAYVTNSVTSNNQSYFDVSTRMLTFLNDPNKTVTEDKYIPWWESVLGALTLEIMNVVIDAISLAIENAVGDLVSSKTATALGTVAPGLISWNGQDNINITAGGLEDNVYMQGIID